MARSDGTLTIASVHHFAHELAGELADAAADPVVGVYVHGSAVLGDWIPGRSDVDLLVVVTDAPPNGVEASVVAAGAASVPRAPWPVIVHVTTAPPDRKTVFGASDTGDPDLILHYAVTRDAGWSAFGPRPETVVGAIPDGLEVFRVATFDEGRAAVEAIAKGRTDALPRC